MFNQRRHMKYLLTVALLILVVGCAEPKVRFTPMGGMCTLSGTYKSCRDNGDGTSTHVTLTTTGSSLSEDIESFNSSSNCTGLSSTNSFTATVSVGPVMASSTVPGGTDITIIPSMDIGCGVGGNGYTVIKFLDDCSGFMPGVGQPSCTEAGRPNTLDSSLTFIKQ